MVFGYPCMKCKIFYNQNDSPILDDDGNQCFLINQECVAKDEAGEVLYTTEVSAVPIPCL
jgi:hypothetical protein